MNIVMRELRANRKSLIIWSGCIIVLIAMGMAKYQGFAALGEEADELLATLPEFMQKAFGFGTGKLTEIKNYYSIFYMYFVLMAGIHAVMLGATIILKEARDKTADFLMVKPITRTKIITSKIIAAFINIVIFNIVIGITSISFVSVYNKGESITGDIIRVMIALFIVQCIFLGIGFLISSLTKSAKKASSLSTTILLIMYFLSMARNISDKIDFVKYITPFAYFDAKLAMNGNFDFLYIIISVIIVSIAFIITYINNQKRDII
ncbi:MAG: ABC transporter permease [Vallitalea sp.]|jgi:ABC-2 type transport system permease protein|nr:ABC transporter permease [Vallitalea sp.]